MCIELLYLRAVGAGIRGSSDMAPTLEECPPWKARPVCNFAVSKDIGDAILEQCAAFATERSISPKEPEAGKAKFKRIKN